MSRRAKIHTLALSILGGVTLASFQKFELYFVAVFTFAAIIFYVVAKNFLVVAAVIALIAFSWFFIFRQFKIGNITTFDGEDIWVTGQILSLQKQDFSTSALIKIETVEYKGKVQKGTGIVNLAGSVLNGTETGETVRIFGNFAKPTEEKELRYNFPKNISGDISAKNIERIKTTPFGQVKKILARLHDLCIQRMNAVFISPVNAMLGALLLGARTNVPREITNAFKATGTTHILALSGYNISIIFSTIELFLAKIIRPKPRYIISGGFIIAFLFLVGFSSSIVRAAVMGIIAGAVSKSGRITAGLTVLLLASTVMVIANPKILAFDVSFQLSALATFGIMGFEKAVESKLKFLPNFFQLREILSTTIAAQIPTMPILIYTFQNLSTLSLVSNILVLPIVPLIMAAGFSNLLLALFFLPMARLISPITAFLVNLMDGILLFLSKWQFALLQFKIPTIFILAYSVLVAAFFIYLEKKKSWE
jgi:competence protein ComEC